MKYPVAPRSLEEDAQKAWNQLVKALEIRDNSPLGGVAGQDYTVSGSVTVAVTIDLGATPTAAVVQGFCKLLKDLRNKSIIQVVLKP